MTNNVKTFQELTSEEREASLDKCISEWKPTREFKSQLTNCILEHRKGDPEFFFIEEGGNVICDLDGYAVVPRERYEEMQQKITQLEMATKKI
jgi:hypothetical protein